METDRLLAADPVSGADVPARASRDRIAAPEDRPAHTTAHPGETLVEEQ